MDVIMTDQAQEAPPAYEPQLGDLKRDFQNASDTQQRAREAARTNRRYYDSKQIGPADLKVLAERRQPPQVDNVIKPAINGMIGVVERGEIDPKAAPRTPDRENAADTATDLLQLVYDDTKLHDIKLKVFENMLIEGIGASITEVDERMNVAIRRIRFEEFFYDPFSRETDFSDAAFMGIAKWSYVQDVAKLYPEFAAELRNQCSAGDASFTFDDRPQHNMALMWTDPKLKRLLVIEMYRRDGGWKKVVFTGSLLLEAGDSPYLDDYQQPANPISAAAIYVDDDNARYGVVSDWLSNQDGINKRKSKLLYLTSARQIQQVAPDAAEVSADEARLEAARPDGVLPAGWQVVPTTDMFEGNYRLLQEDKQSIQRAGVNPAVLGREGENQSGRANLVRQQAGLTELAIIYKALKKWEEATLSKAWERIRQFWTEPMVKRVTRDEDSWEFLHLNQPVIEVRDQVVGYDTWTGQPIIQPVPVQVGVENAIAKMEIDIILDSVPDTANVQQEQFQILSDLARAYGPQEVPFDDLLALSALPHKAQIMDRRKARQERAAQAAQNPNPAQQLAMRGAAAKVAKDEADVGKTQAETAETQAEAAIKAQQAQNPMLEGWLNAG